MRWPTAEVIKNSHLKMFNQNVHNTDKFTALKCIAAYIHECG